MEFAVGEKLVPTTEKHGTYLMTSTVVDLGNRILFVGPSSEKVIGGEWLFGRASFNAGTRHFDTIF